MPPVSGSRLLLVEGVPGIGKSTLLDRLLRHHISRQEEGRLRTVLNLAQTHSYGPLAQGEDDGTLTAAENLAHLERIVGALEWLVHHARGQSRPKTFILVDTLHFTHCVRPGVVEWTSVTPIDRRLAAIECRLVLLDATDETVRARTVVARAHTEFIQSYARGRFGSDERQFVEHFTRERDRFRVMFEASAMDKMRLAAEESIEETAAAAARFWLT
jgi:hypothetical protein